MPIKTIAKKSEFLGKLSLRELEKNPFEFSGNQHDSWIYQVLLASAPQEALMGLSAEEWASRGILDLSVRVEKIGAEYELRGSLKGRVLAPCSRCGDPFEVGREGAFRVFFVNPKNERDFSDDPDFQFLEKDEIDLVSAISEQLIVLEGVAECPGRLADGTCQLCGKNPQYGSEASFFQSEEQKKENLANSPFAKLKGLKLSKEN